MSIADWANGTANVSDRWPMDGEGPGTEIGTIQWVSGVEGQAASSDGSAGFVVTPNQSRTHRNVTVAVWVNVRDGSGDVFRWGTSPGIHIEAARTGSGLTLSAGVRMSNGGWAQRITRQGLSVGQWHLVVIAITDYGIWGGVQSSLYIDGDHVGTNRYNGGLFDRVSFDRPTTLSVLTSSVQASVDEVMLIGRQVTASEVSALWRAGGSGVSGPGYGWGVIF